MGQGGLVGGGGGSRETGGLFCLVVCVGRLFWVGYALFVAV